SHFQTGLNQAEDSSPARFFAFVRTRQYTESTKWGKERKKYGKTGQATSGLCKKARAVPGCKSGGSKTNVANNGERRLRRLQSDDGVPSMAQCGSSDVV